MLSLEKLWPASERLDKVVKAIQVAREAGIAIDAEEQKLGETISGFLLDG